MNRLVTKCFNVSGMFFFVGYIGEFEIIDDHRAGKIVVHLNGRLNKCAVISPRYDVSLADIEQWASNLLPSRQFGYDTQLILSTIMILS